MSIVAPRREGRDLPASRRYGGQVGDRIDAGACHHIYFEDFLGSDFRDFFGWNLLDCKRFEKEWGWRVGRLKSRMKKYGLFWKLFFVDGQGVNPDLAICNKRFVRRFHRRMIKGEAMDSPKSKVQSPKSNPDSESGRLRRVQSWKKGASYE